MRDGADNRRLRRLLAGLTALLLGGISIVSGSGNGQEPAGSNPRRDPAKWGGNHAGQPVPEYVQGDECLFCHRNEIGPRWSKDAHALTVRSREAAPELEPLIIGRAGAGEATHFLGSRHFIRLLKKDGYGRFAITGERLTLASGDWSGPQTPVWDRDGFASRCAGCHSTGVDPADFTFSGVGLDCYTCHGNVDLNHTRDKSLVWFSRKRRGDALAVTAVCAQCHLRGGQSRSTGRPYPNNFIAGDNLFQDFEVDLTRADDPQLNAGDRHIWRNVRDVAVNGDESVTCLSCHQVHEGSTLRHRRVLRAPICTECHAPEGPLREVRRYTVRSELCQY